MPLVFSEAAPSRISAKPRLLICDPVGARLPIESFSANGYEAELAKICRPISPQVRNLLSAADLVLFDLTTSSRDVLNTIHELIAAIGIGGLRPRLLCYSTVHRNPQFVLGLQKCGARYVRVGSAEILLEAIDLQAAEINDLERNGPSFQIIHRFSQGICTPGEEISAVLLAHAGDFFQLRLGLAERFVFDFLAQRRIAVDSLQIVSGLAGDAFYREHAANSGRRQLKKIRRPTVKVLVQRIRDAMASAFGQVRVGFSPHDVLRSCPAQGTNQVLYRLIAQVRWRHFPR